MFPCCNMTYHKYVNEDGTFDRQTYDRIREDILRQPKKRKDQRTEKEQEMLEKQFPPLLADVKPCMCGCHVKGQEILH